MKDNCKIILSWKKGIYQCNDQMWTSKAVKVIFRIWLHVLCLKPQCCFLRLNLSLFTLISKRPKIAHQVLKYSIRFKVSFFNKSGTYVFEVFDHICCSWSERIAFAHLAFCWCRRSGCLICRFLKVVELMIRVWSCYNVTLICLFIHLSVYWFHQCVTAETMKLFYL